MVEDLHFERPRPLTSEILEQQSFQKLAKIYGEKTKRLVVICGAGASKEAAMPTWDDLIERIKENYLKVATTSIGQKLADEISLQIKYMPDNWQRMSRLKELMGAQYEQVVRNILTPNTDIIPTFYRDIWELEPHALLTFNLDNFANISYVKKKTGILQNHLFGLDAPNSRVGLGDGRPLIVDLHGNVDTPHSWILTREDRDKLLSLPGYIEFLKSMFTHNVVVFYGVGVEDFTVSGQLSYLRNIDFITGDYFIVKREPSEEDKNLSHRLPLNIIYTGKDKSWESGFSDFVKTLKKNKSDEDILPPVVSRIVTQEDIPTPDQMVSLDHDTIRQHLASATRKFYKGDDFDYEAYRNFCRKYDTAIHISTRVNPNEDGHRWLGNRITAELGRGNFGRVYQAFNQNEESIAIKVAHMEIRDDEAMLNSFRRGVDSMRFLSNSNISGIVHLIDASELPPSIIMEYIQGVDLQKYINDNYASTAIQKLYICLWISEIIFECHSHEHIILHRDLRPSNIMLTGDYWERITKEDVRILDFDLSWFKGASGSEFYMNASQALGFLAPEQIDARSRYSNRSALVDVYGVGMLLYFMISSEIPLANASSRTDWKNRVTAASAAVFNKDWKSTKFLFENLILKSTSESQELRPQLPDFIENLSKIIGIFEARYPLDLDSCIIEILARISPGGADINFDPKKRVGHYTSGAGAQLEILTNGTEITCSIKRMMREGANRVTRGRDLADALFKARGKAESFARIDERGTGTIMGGNQLKFSFDAPDSLKAVASIASGIDFAIVEISKD
ncbi:serine/threonine protein kinase [Rhizobium sp. OAE497]